MTDEPKSRACPQCDRRIFPRGASPPVYCAICGTVLVSAPAEPRVDVTEPADAPRDLAVPVRQHRAPTTPPAVQSDARAASYGLPAVAVHRNCRTEVGVMLAALIGFIPVLGIPFLGTMAILILFVYVERVRGINDHAGTNLLAAIVVLALGTFWQLAWLGALG